MKRRPEPELMTDDAQALAYAQADFREPNSRFVELFATQWTQHGYQATRDYHAIDLGCGPADIPLRLLKRYPRLTCDAIDGSAAMLAQAQLAITAQPQYGERLRLIHACLPLTLTAESLWHHGRPPAHYTVIISNSLLHHLPDPAILWETIGALAQPGTFVFVVDLMRPPEPSWVEALVKTYAANEPAILQRDFRQSLFAAFEPAEIQSQLHAAGLAPQLTVQVISDRHVAVWGQF